jgi:hypothetical protein
MRPWSPVFGVLRAFFDGVLEKASVRGGVFVVSLWWNAW